MKVTLDWFEYVNDKHMEWICFFYHTEQLNVYLDVFIDIYIYR